MCGIFGFYVFGVKTNLKQVLAIVFNGLKRLEYRGYDSAGICLDVVDPFPLVAAREARKRNSTTGEADGPLSPAVVKEAGAPPLIVKAEGKVESLEKLTYGQIERDGVDLLQPYLNQVGISHTRWATHGQPSTTNAHPQVSDAELEFVVVHNGIITNYTLLKEFLTKHGVKFVSETDTEVIPKLCKYVYDSLPIKPPFPTLIMEVLQKIEGAYALLIKSRHYAGEMVACKRGSPMILGILEGETAEAMSPRRLRPRSFHNIHDARDATWRANALECFIASDASAVIEHTKNVIIMEDNDVLHLAGGGYGIYNTGQQNVDEAVPRVLLTLELEVNQIMKGGYDHFMQKEIHEQPESLTQTMRGRVQFHRPAGDAYLSQRIKLGGLLEHGKAICRGRRVMFVACGTSYHACLASRQTVEELCDLPVVLELASDLLDRRCPIFRDDTCIFVSQSGETADTLRALEYAKERGALCVGVTNTVGSAISRTTHCGVHLNAGYEIGVASTKSYTSMIVAITMMALQLSEDSISRREKRDAIIDALERLPAQVREVLELDNDMLQLAKQLHHEHSLMFFARGYNYSTAMEAALKFKEVALIHSEGVLAGEMKHGPLALVDEHLPIIVIATRDCMYKKMESVIQQLLARGARLYIMCNKGDEKMLALQSQDCRLIQVPETVGALQPVINIVPLQLLSYHLTVLRGLNVDQPRNLAKSVTVSEEH